MEVDGVPVAEDEADRFLNGDVTEVDGSVEIQNKTFLVEHGSLPGISVGKRVTIRRLCAPVQPDSL